MSMASIARHRPRWLLFALLLLVPALLVTSCGGDDDDGADPTATPALPGGEPLRKAVHWHADFLLVIDGEAFDFEQPQFVSEEGEHHVHEYLHIHPFRYSVVHVHLENSTWREFFGTFGWTLSDTYLDMMSDTAEIEPGTRFENDDEKTWKFFVNGVRVDSVQFLNIGDLQRVLMVYGDETVEEAFETYWPQVTDEACIVSGSCADRIDPNEPPEQCSGGTTCN